VSQNDLARFRQLHLHLPSILRVSGSFDEAAAGKTVDQADCAVMANQKVGSQFADGWALGPGERPNREQHLMLLRFEPFLPGGVLAKMQKPPDLIAEISKGSIVVVGQFAVTHLL